MVLNHPFGRRLPAARARRPPVMQWPARPPRDWGGLTGLARRSPSRWPQAASPHAGRAPHPTSPRGHRVISRPRKKGECSLRCLRTGHTQSYSTWSRSLCCTVRRGSSPTVPGVRIKLPRGAGWGAENGTLGSAPSAVAGVPWGLGTCLPRIRGTVVHPHSLSLFFVFWFSRYSSQLIPMQTMITSALCSF